MGEVLDGPLGLLASRETKQRLDGLAQLEAVLGSVELDPDTVAHLVGALVPVVGDNNPKMAQGAMQLLQLLGQASGPEFGPLALSAWSALVERMGDSKLAVRSTATATLVSCLKAVGPQVGVEKLRLALEHKNPRAREQGLEAMGQALVEFGAKGAGVHLILPHAVKLLEDSDSNVREAAAMLLERTYEQLGPSLLDELQRRALRPAVLKSLLDRLSQLPTRTDLSPAAAVALLRGKGGSQPGYEPNGQYGNGHPPERAFATPPITLPPPPLARAPSGGGSARAPSPGGRLGRGLPSPRGQGALAARGPDGLADSGDLDVLAPSADVKPLRVHTERDLNKELESPIFI
ncbi:armadillo-type protein [Pavlovales sp. CCMP2436]|nr:armadillo-type protein [Pavlovales sp. CCMP2436]